MLTRRNVVKGILLFVFPWFPAYLFERIDFYFGVSVSGALYYDLSGPRLEADVVSFALGGILIAYLLRPRWAVIQVFLSAALFWSQFYVFCPTFTTAGLLHSECYQTGPDSLAGIRLAGMMFSFGALPAIVKAASKRDALNKRIRPVLAMTSGIVLTVVMIWFPLTAWFSGVTYLPSVVLFQELGLVGVPQIATGILAARIGRTLKLAASSGPISLLAVSGGLSSLSCPDCDRTLLYPLAVTWTLFAFMGGLLELGPPSSLRLPFGLAWIRRIELENVRKIGLAIVIVTCLLTPVGYGFWDPRVLYAPSISPGNGQLILGQSIYPYVAGYYNSTQYRICCLELGVSLATVNMSLLAPDNFLMAGMGVQSPNCCVDGWDLGWRADAFLLHDRSIIVSGSAWTTCDSNANCGGYFWQQLRYHAQVTLHPQNVSSPIYLRMMWEQVLVQGEALYQANWYYNTTTVSWTRFGSFLPDLREGHYFDIGIPGGVPTNLPGGATYFFQFGVASKLPVAGWKILLLYPSFQYQGTWRMMERANIIQGDYSFWKAEYRWGGEPYQGVTAQSKLTDSNIPPGIVEFEYTGGTLKNNAPAW